MERWARNLWVALIVLAVTACGDSRDHGLQAEAVARAIPTSLAAEGQSAGRAKFTLGLQAVQGQDAYPTIINPSEELAAFAPDGILRWTASVGADAYEVWVYRDADGAQLQEFSKSLTARHYQFTQLLPGAVYYVHLYFRVNGAWSKAPDVVIHTTADRTKPRLINSQEELDAIHAGGTLRWTPISGAEFYELWVFRDFRLEAFAEASGPLQTTQYQLRTLEAGKTYYVQVFARIKGAFHVGGPLPLAVVGTSKTARIVNPQEELEAFATNGLLRWTRVDGATAYELWVFTNPNSSEIYESSGTLTARSYAARTLQPGQTYFAQVYALVDNRWQVGSPVKVVTAPAVRISRLTNPQEELEAFPVNGSLQWTSVAGAGQHEIWIYGNAGLGVVAERWAGPGRTYSVQRLCSDATYYVQVHALVDGRWTVGWPTRLDMAPGISPSDCVAPVPVVRLRASATEVTAGQQVTLAWSARFAQTCLASDGWSGTPPLSGELTVGPITTTTLFTLNCTGVSGSSRAQVLVATIAAVPNVLGLSEATARSVIEAAGFVVGSVTQVSHPTVPAGIVSSQNPTAGQLVVSGGNVSFVVSTGSGPATRLVPNVVGLPQTAATYSIVVAGLTVGTIASASSVTVPAGEVISQSPAAGQTVGAGSAVSVVVSSGPGGGTAVVPNVVGMTQAAASNAIILVGCVIGTVTQQASAAVPAGHVVSQSPAGGTSVAKSSAVNLVVSTGASGGNQAPIATISKIQMQGVRDRDPVAVTVAYDGRGSRDPDGQVFEYEWTIVKKPTGSVRAVLERLPRSNDPALVAMTPDIEGEYRVQLKVSDGQKWSAPAEYVLTVVRPPIVAKLIKPYVPWPWTDRFCPDLLEVLGGPVGDLFEVIVSVTSDYPNWWYTDVSRVTATVAGRQVPLQVGFIKCSPTIMEQPVFRGPVSLAGLPIGPYEMVISATDRSGYTDEFAVTVTHSN